MYKLFLLVLTFYVVVLKHETLTTYQSHSYELISWFEILIG